MARRTSLVFLSTLLTIAVVAPVAASSSFTDVPDTNIFADDIEWLRTMGITEGCNPPTNDHFCPTQNVTSGQMAAFLVRALGLIKTIDHDHFDDDNGSVFEDDIDKLYTAGITAGCNPPTNNNYCPNNNVTREQMAAFLRRGLDDPPSKVTGLVATLSGGSGEVYVYWNPNSEPDIDHYNVWYSEQPGDPKTLITDPLEGPGVELGRVYIVDFPRSQSSGIDCYQVSAVDMAGQAGSRSTEECFDSTPGAPSQVTEVTVGSGSVKAEAYVSWKPNFEGDMNYYNVYYSEFPGGPYVWEATVDETVRNGLNRVYYIDWPVATLVGKTCYEITGVDLNGKEGLRSVEACFTP